MFHPGDTLAWRLLGVSLDTCLALTSGSPLTSNHPRQAPIHDTQPSTARTHPRHALIHGKHSSTTSTHPQQATIHSRQPSAWTKPPHHHIVLRPAQIRPFRHPAALES